jgi:hypothetical protein
MSSLEVGNDLDNLNKFIEYELLIRPFVKENGKTYRSRSPVCYDNFFIVHTVLTGITVALTFSTTTTGRVGHVLLGIVAPDLPK